MKRSGRKPRYLARISITLVSTVFILAGCSTEDPATPFDPSVEWTPSNEITLPAPLSEAEQLQLRNESLYFMIQTWDLAGKVEEPSKIPVKQWLRQDLGPFFVCMADQGWMYSDEGEISVPLTQTESFDIAHYYCKAQFPSDLSYAQPLGESMLNAMYDYLTEWLLPCLKSEGIDPGSPPSRQLYRESEIHWSPYIDLAVSHPDPEALMEKCPEHPDWDAILGLQ